MRSIGPSFVLLGCLFLLLGCGGPTATVSGKVTCQGKPVVGVILFSSKEATGNNAEPAVSTTLSADGEYELRLTSIGKHSIVITPSDVVLRPKKGSFDYPCDRSPLERDIVAGKNDITIELAKRTK